MFKGLPLAVGGKNPRQGSAALRPVTVFARSPSAGRVACQSGGLFLRKVASVVASLRLPHFCPPPAVPPGLAFLILPSAGAPGETKVEGAACCGSVCARPFRCAPGPAQTLTPAARGEWRAGAEYRFFKNEPKTVYPLGIVASWERFRGE